MLDSKKPEAFMSGGSPEGKIDAAADSLYLNTDAAVLFVKVTGKGSKAGWSCLGQILKPAIQPALPRS
jgi:hypothetical protein